MVFLAACLFQEILNRLLLTLVSSRPIALLSFTRTEHAMIRIPDPPANFPSAIHQGATEPTGRMHPTFPQPDPATGALVIDPEIKLKSRGFDLEVSLFYSTNAKSTTPWGVGRSASIAGSLSKAGLVATITRGNFAEQYYREVGTSGGITTFVSSNDTGNVTTLSYNTTTQEFTEYFLNGMQMIYKDHGGSSSSFEISRVLDPSGNTHTYMYTGGLLNAIEVPGGRRLSLSYTSGPGVSLVSSVEDWGNRRWTMQYDGQGFLTTLVTPLGCTTRFGYSLAGAGSPNTLVHTIEDSRGYITTYHYNAQRQVVSMTAGTGAWTYSYAENFNVEYWPSGARVTYNIGAAGNITNVVTADGVSHTFTYNTNRIKLTEVTPAGTVYDVGYDSKNRLSYSADPLGNRTTYQYDSFDNITTVLYADGGIITFGYEGSGSTRRRIRQTDQLGRVTSMTYNANGLLQTVTDPRGLTTENQYDSYGNLTTIIYSDGGVVKNAYDTLGRLTATTDQLGRTTSYTYDAADHILSVRNPMNEVTTFIYDGCLLQAQVNPLNQRTSYTYGRFNKLTTVKNALGFVTTTNYDNMGYPVEVIDALGAVSTTVYDVAKRVVASIDPLGFRTTFGYDNAGRPSFTVNPRGFITTSVYNARDLIASIDSAGQRTSFNYDSMGRQVSVQDARGFLTTSLYDLAGQTTANVDALGFRTTFSYDLAGNQTQVQNALGALSTSVYFTTSNRVQATIDATDRKSVV